MNERISHGEKVELFSYTKCNANLKVLERRPDGYHDLKSQVVMLDNPVDSMILSDFTSNWESMEISSNISALEDVKSNLIYVALKASKEYFFNLGVKVSLPQRIELNKTIPIFAGLGGGSSNAASILLWVGAQALKRTDEILTFLKEVAPLVGSDVLACCFESCEMLGRGEQVQDEAKLIDPTKKYKGTGEAITLIMPNIECNTADVFKRFAMMEKRSNHTELNDLTEAATDLYPKLKEFIAFCDELKVPVTMLGSGSTLLTAKNLNQKEITSLSTNAKLVKSNVISKINLGYLPC
jgi:4-diphosphocytidyl-2-C-methyl-D-erythritol kinase